MFRNNILRDFDEDPFFSDPFRAHGEHMRQVMRSFSEPFGRPFMPSIMDGRSHDAAGQTSSSPALRNDNRDMTTNPFGMVDHMMANMRSRMDEMHRSFGNMSADPNTHSFSSSSVMTYSKVGNDPPKVFQASSSTRCAPGGIKETRRTLKDSDSGLEKMSIGHHIKDRGHVVERKSNRKTGEKELIQDFQNMDESEARAFDEEWQQSLSNYQSDFMSRPGQRQLRGSQQAALPPSRQAQRDQTAKEKRRSDRKVSIKP
ncbi:myeloid leukemia factor 1 [Synchiropus splendidus]|uniref:myeloid leukemia factor 1 n=1 Tax=Synchiropus splendidus TaxID=270530 RepID=UPI00237DE658|nr:myeloid leukemia factor 1 [Synchiropus splendidus]